MSKRILLSTLTVTLALAFAACTHPIPTTNMSSTSSSMRTADLSAPVVSPASPDPRVGLKPGLQDAGEAIWNLKKVSHVQSPEGFAGITNSDLAFYGSNVVEGNYNGFQIWDVSDPAHPRVRDKKICPASQSDVSVWKNLLFVSSESPTGRLDCGAQAPREVVSKDRIRGLRIFDISDIDNPKYIANVQTCRGSHTHTVVHDPKDAQNIYVYISGTSGIRPSEELARCNDNPWDPNNSNFRIEVIKIPLAHPEQAAVVSSPAIFADPTTPAGELLYTASHGASPADTAANRARTQLMAELAKLPTPRTAADSATCNQQVTRLAAQYGVNVTGGRGGPPSCGPQAAGGRGGRVGGGGGRGGNNAPMTKADSARVQFLSAMQTVPPLADKASAGDTASYKKTVDALAKKYGVASPYAPRTLTQCHDITVYPAVGMAGGACAGMGLLLDIRDTPHPTRLTAVADSNFSFWHSATFSNDGDMILFSDEWGGGGAAYCRKDDPKNWGADAIFKIVNGKMEFQSYYKMPAAQTQFENCVAHNGSLIPIPGRTIMVQAWYQGGLSMFEWTDPKHPHEIGFFDRGPNDGTRLASGGFWSVYWYNGYIYGSEIARGLDVFELSPSEAISQNEIDASKTVHFDFLNVQDQPKLTWPASFALSKSYVDQLARWHGLSADKISNIRAKISSAESMSGSGRRDALNALSKEVNGYTSDAADQARVQWLSASLRDLAAK